MASDRGTKTSERPVRGKDGRNSCEITKDEMREYIKIAGQPWHNRRKKIPLGRVKILREAGFSLKQVAKIYRTSETTIRRRLKGE
jgi:hypothetical protein